MIVGGCDIGSATGKVVIMENGEMVSCVFVPSTTNPEKTARLVMDQALDRVGLESIEDLDYIVGTGYGRSKVPFANENICGINHSVAGRLNSMVRRVGPIEDVALTGGCSKNEGLVKALETKLGV